MQKIKISMEAELEVFYAQDSEQLKQVFFNIIGNSIDAINEESEIRILSGLEENFVYIKVIDHGGRDQ